MIKLVVLDSSHLSKLVDTFVCFSLQCLKQIWGIWVASSLQSSTKGEIRLLGQLGKDKISVTDFASNSTSIALKFRLMQSKRPSQRAYSSAKKLDVMPIFLVNPTIQAPSSSQITHPPPTRPEFPSDDPSVFHFTQPRVGLSHLICLIT